VRRTVDATALPDGFACPHCAGPSRGYMASRRVHECVRCGYQCSVTAGYDLSQDPHCSVQLVLGHLSHEPRQEGHLGGATGQGDRRQLPTAWLIEHKIRKAMEDRDQHYTLRGLVEVDEGYVGGEEHGEPRKGRGARNKAVVAVAVEHSRRRPAGQAARAGFAALSVLANAGSSSLDGFLKAKVEPGSHVLTDGWNGYWHVEQNGFTHTAIECPSRTNPPTSSSPGSIITLSNLKRFLLGTHHRVERKHLRRMSPSSTTASTEDPWKRTCSSDSSAPASPHIPSHIEHFRVRCIVIPGENSAANGRWRNRMATICVASCWRPMIAGRARWINWRRASRELAVGVEDFAQRKHSGQMERIEQRRGSRRKVTPEVEQRLRGWIEVQPDLTLAELQQKLETAVPVHVSVGRLWQVLRQMGLRLKKSHSTPSNATAKRTAGGGKSSLSASRPSPPEKLIFLDESGVTTQMTRGYARASGGRACMKPLRQAIGRSSPSSAP